MIMFVLSKPSPGWTKHGNKDFSLGIGQPWELSEKSKYAMSISIFGVNEEAYNQGENGFTKIIISLESVQILRYHVRGGGGEIHLISTKMIMHYMNISAQLNLKEFRKNPSFNELYVVY